MFLAMLVVIALFVVVALPIITFVIRDIWKQKMHLREKELDVLSQDAAGNAAQYAAHIAHLEQRVRVLERIATDTGSDLAAQIESLRDQPLN